MSNYDNTNRGALFRNTRRRDDKDPSHTGSINVEGCEFWIDAWVNESKKDGSRYFRINVRPKDAPAKAAPEKPAAPEPEELNDDIPFVWAFAIPLAAAIGSAAYAQDLFSVWM